MKLIPLNRGMVAKVDDADFTHLSRYNWFANRGRGGRFYAVRHTPGDHAHYVKMHRELLGITDPDIKVDHIDNDPLNNQRYNLRPATNSQNCMNRQGRANSNSKSGVLGVSFDKRHRKWFAQIQIGNKRKTLGRFKTIEEARAVREAAAKIHYGEFSGGAL